MRKFLPWPISCRQQFVTVTGIVSFYNILKMATTFLWMNPICHSFVIFRQSLNNIKVYRLLEFSQNFCVLLRTEIHTLNFILILSWMKKCLENCMLFPCVLQFVCRALGANKMECELLFHDTRLALCTTTRLSLVGQDFVSVGISYTHTYISLMRYTYKFNSSILISSIG